MSRSRICTKSRSRAQAQSHHGGKERSWIFRTVQNERKRFKTDIQDAAGRVPQRPLGRHRTSGTHILVDNRFLAAPKVELCQLTAACTSATSGSNERDVYKLSMKENDAVTAIHSEMTRLKRERKGRRLFKQEVYKIGKRFVLQNAQGAHRSKKMCRSNSIRINFWPRLRSVT